MRKLRICIGSNDGENLAPTHMGDTEFFYLYDFVELKFRVTPLPEPS